MDNEKKHGYEIRKKKYELEVDRTYIEENIEPTYSCAKISLEKCQTAEDFQKLILFNCRDSVKRWPKALEKLIDNNLDASGKTIKKGIISDIFSIADLQEREKFVNREFGEGSISRSDNRTIYERYFQNKTLENFTLTKQALGDMASKCYGSGTFTRGVIDHWFEGTIPQDKNRVIKLAFWAKCTLEETNKLLECAGMHKLYLKGTGVSATLQNSLQDIVYMFMLKRQCYSFATAQELIYQLDCQLLENAKKKVIGTDDVLETEEKNIDKKDNSTWNLFYNFNNLNSDMSSFIMYFNKYIPYFISSYNTLYGNIAILFTDKYCIYKNNQLDASQNSIRALTNSAKKVPVEDSRTKQNSAENSKVDKWPSSLSNLLYAAFGIVKRPKKQKKNPKKQETAPEPIHKHMERIFSRNDIITMGIILNCSKAGINNLLNLAQEPPLYARNFIENVIMKASYDTSCEVSDGCIIEKFTDEHCKCYKIEKEQFANAIHTFLRFYSNQSKYKRENMDFSDVINALRSLKKYEWIKSISVVKEIYPLNKITVINSKLDKETQHKLTTINQENVFVIKITFRHAVEKRKKESKKNTRSDLKKKQPLADIEKTVCLKKFQIVRPIAYRYSKELLSLYPEKVMFDFLVRKTAFYLTNKEYCKYLIPFQKDTTNFKKEKIVYELPLHF